MCRLLSFVFCCRSKVKTKDKELKSRNSRLMKTSSTAKSHLFDSKNDNKNPLTDKQRAREEYRIEYRFESKLESKADTDANHAIRLKERGYDIIGGGVVRRGVFSKVFSVVRQTDGQTMGCKAIQNREICESLSLFKEVKWEIIMTNATNSPRFMHLIRYFNAFIYDRKYAYILMEECPTGQSLQTRLSARADGFPEEEAAVYFRQIALAINYLHIQTIAHRNLKLDNVLIFKTPDGRDLLKVTDYCLNRVSKKSDRVVVYERDAKRIIYMSPQILKFYAKHLRKTYKKTDRKIKEYDPIKGDIWALGVCLFILLTKRPPYGLPPNTKSMDKSKASQAKVQFLCDCLEKFGTKTVKSKLLISKEMVDKLSANCTDLLNELLEPLTKKRIEHNGVCRHKWVRLNPMFIEKQS